MLLEDKINLLRNTSFLKDIPFSALEELGTRATLVHYPAREIVVEKGMHGSTMYCIVEGSAARKEIQALSPSSVIACNP